MLFFFKCEISESVAHFEVVSDLALESSITAGSEFKSRPWRVVVVNLGVNHSPGSRQVFAGSLDDLAIDVWEKVFQDACSL